METVRLTNAHKSSLQGPIRVTHDNTEVDEVRDQLSIDGSRFKFGTGYLCNIYNRGLKTQHSRAAFTHSATYHTFNVT